MENNSKNKQNRLFKSGRHELEQAVLAACLLERDAFFKVSDILNADSFTSAAHATIWKAVERMAKQAVPIDLITLTNELKQLGQLDYIGGAPYVVEISSRVVSSANIEAHARILKQHHLRDLMRKAGERLLQEAGNEEEDVFDSLKSAGDIFATITTEAYAGSTLSAKVVAANFIKEAEEKRNRSEEVLGTPSGYKDLDAANLFLPGNLLVLAARPGMGKTALALCVALNAAKTGKRVLFFSLEMSANQLFARLVSIESGLQGKYTQDPKRLSGAQYERFTQTVEVIADLPIWIEETPGLSLQALKAKARKVAMQEGALDLVVVDYLQLMSGGKSERWKSQNDIVGGNSKGLKELAKSLTCPVLCLSQLSRAVEARGGDKRPKLPDLRDSGAIEQDADAVLFLYRPSYYKIDFDEDGRSTKGLAEIILAKNRHGKLGTELLKFDAERTAFSNYTEEADLFAGIESPAESEATNKFTDTGQIEDLPF